MARLSRPQPGTAQEQSGAGVASVPSREEDGLERSAGMVLLLAGRGEERSDDIAHELIHSRAGGMHTMISHLRCWHGADLCADRTCVASLQDICVAAILGSYRSPC